MPDFTDQQYDEFLAFVEQARESVGPPSWVICRSQEEAEAFAAWCVENGIEQPQIATPENQAID